MHPHPIKLNRYIDSALECAMRYRTQSYRICTILLHSSGSMQRRRHSLPLNPKVEAESDSRCVECGPHQIDWRVWSCPQSESDCHDLPTNLGCNAHSSDFEDPFSVSGARCADQEVYFGSALRIEASRITPELAFIIRTRADTSNYKFDQ